MQECLITIFLSPLLGCKFFEIQPVCAMLFMIPSICQVQSTEHVCSGHSWRQQPSYSSIEPRRELCLLLLIPCHSPFMVSSPLVTPESLCQLALSCNIRQAQLWSRRPVVNCWSLIRSFVHHLFSKHLLTTQSVLGTVLDAWDTIALKTDMNP